MECEVKRVMEVVGNWGTEASTDMGKVWCEMSELEERWNQEFVSATLILKCQLDIQVKTSSWEMDI